MKNAINAFFALLLSVTLHEPLHAHEFWIAPVTTPLTSGSTARLSLRVGEQFTGDLVGWSKAQTAGLRLVSNAGAQDISAQVPATPVADLPIALAAPGTHLVAFESQPHTITLSADTFHAYLHDEGLNFIKAQRQAAGQAKQPGRERYRRFVKTLLRVEPNAEIRLADATQSVAVKPDTTYATRTGQQLEVLPTRDPTLLTAGDTLGVLVEFEGKPLAGALLKAWHKRSSQTLIIRAKTSAGGTASFDLPYAGPWMISVVHMVPSVGVKGIDWDSLWGNLSFSLATPDQKK